MIPSLEEQADELEQQVRAGEISIEEGAARMRRKGWSGQEAKALEEQFRQRFMGLEEIPPPVAHKRWFPSRWARLTQPDWGRQHDIELVAKYLIVGHSYPVQAEDIHATSGRVLLELPGGECRWFNTVHFADVERPYKPAPAVPKDEVPPATAHRRAMKLGRP